MAFSAPSGGRSDIVLSTLHCNDTVDAVQRLFDLGMHANSVASELIAVFAQRLAKRICLSCRERCEPDPEIAAEVFPGGVHEGLVTYRGRGCTHCGGFGTYGRIAVVEYLPSSPELREAGLVPMRDHALELVGSVSGAPSV